jgi:predicted GIY-YIG superfamily endonuclease
MIRVETANVCQLNLVKGFGDAVEGLDHSLRTLLACQPITFNTKPRHLPNEVVYLFSNGATPVYVGRSNKFRQRLGNHCRHGSQANQASLAFRLACAEVQHVRQKYRRGYSAADALQNVDGLQAAFSAMKIQLRSMEIRYVSEPEQVKQALLEMYVALALDIPHDFGTH